ncbi:MAG: signal peptidase I [Bacilli bacterium]|nr:signal peptidase I [Bacilli bacterium]MDD4077047.1 signal peptidase I [Bacilli bacterium]
MIKKTVWILFFLIFLLLAATAVLPIFGIKYYTVITDSMTPAIKKNSLVYVNTKIKKIEIGDIIAVKTAGIPLLHRVVAFDEGYVITKGDANDTPDAPRPDEDIIGVAVFHIPYLGIIFSRQYLIIIVVLAGLLYIVGARLFKELKKKEVGDDEGEKKTNI